MPNFKPLTNLIYHHKPTILATAIEQQGIYFRNDTLGTVKLAKDDCDAWQCRRDPLYMQKIIFHTEDETTAPRNTKSRALALLEIYIETRGLRRTFQDPITDSYSVELRNFGWPSVDLPDFAAIQPGAVTQTTRKEEQVQASPETDYSNRHKETDQLSVFREMDNLKGEDLKIEFAPNEILVISISDVTKRVAYSDLELANKKSGGLNKQGVLLLGIAQGNTTIPRSEEKTVSKIRGIIRKKLGITHNSFHCQIHHFAPRFQVVDGRKKADKRAYEKALRTQCKGGPIIDHGDPDRGKDDDAAIWLKENS